MSKSLQDQLLSLGVTDRKKAKRAKHEQRIEVSKSEIVSIQQSLDESRRLASEEKINRDRKLAEERQKKLIRAEKIAQVRDIIEKNEVDRGQKSDRISFKFPYGTKIRPFPVSANVREQLAKGKLGLIEIDGAIKIVGREHLQKCIERLEGQFIFTHLAKPDIADDDYPPIPDDIDW